MQSVLIAVVVGLAISAASEDATPPENWVGKGVILKATPASLPSFKGVTALPRENAYFKVRAEAAGRILIKWETGTRWIDKSDVVLHSGGVPFFSEQIKIQPTNAWMYLGRAACHYPKDRRAAMADLNEAIRLDPALLPAYNRRGWDFFFSKKYDDAWTDFQRMLRLDPQSSSAHCGCGMVLYYGKNKADEALRYFDAATRLAPNEAQFYMFRAQVWLEKADSANGIADCDRAIKLDPKNAGAHQMRGMFAAMQGNIEQAIADLNKVGDAKPPKLPPNTFSGPAFAHLLRAGSNLEKKQFDAALADLDQLIKQNPKNAEWYVLRAEAWAGKKDYVHVTADLTEALRLAPTNDVNIASLASFYAACPDAKFRDGAKALELAKKMKTPDPQLMAAAYAAMGDYRHAVRWQEEALRSPYLDGIDEARRVLQLYKSRAPGHEK